MEERNFLAMLKNFAYGLGGGLNLIAPIVFAKFNSSVKGYNIMNLLAMGIILRARSAESRAFISESNRSRMPDIKQRMF